MVVVVVVVVLDADVGVAELLFFEELALLLPPKRARNCDTLQLISARRWL